jgi:hypothetical protein
MIKSSPAPNQRHEVLSKLVPTEAVGDPTGEGIRPEMGASGVGSSVPSAGSLGNVSKVGEGPGAAGVRVGLLVNVGVGMSVAGSVGKGISVPADGVDVASGATVTVLASVAVAGAVVPVGWLVGTGEGEAVSTGTAVSEGSPGGLVGGSAVGPSVGVKVGTPDGVSVGMV